MPIRINLLAEQQAAEEARRKDPVKRAIWVGSALVFMTLVWTIVKHMEVKGQRAEYANLQADFAKVDDSAKTVRNMQAQAGELEQRVASLEKYSTNRVLWASFLDALQKGTMEQIRFKSITSNQRYVTNAPTNFFVTNLVVDFDPPPPAWKFWASASAGTPVMTKAQAMFKSFTNSPPFTTNTLPYTHKMTITVTNLQSSQVTIKTEFIFPSISTEDFDLTISAGDYGNPPGAMIDKFAQDLASIPYIAERLSKGPGRMRFMDRPPNAEPDMTEPGNPLFSRFSVRYDLEDRVLTNE